LENESLRRSEHRKGADPMSLPDALERAAEALADQADLIRPANGDPSQLLATLDADGGQRVLIWLLANEPAAGEELLTAWCDDDRGVERVQSIDVGQLPKPGKKLLRTALHRLRTSGVAVAAGQSAERVVSKLSEVADEIAGAYMTAVDPRGSVLLFIVEANPSGGARLFQILLDERRGIAEFEVYSTGRSKTRSFIRKLTDSTQMGGAGTGSAGAEKIDGEIARGMIRRIAEIHPADRPFPRAFSEWRRKLEIGAADETLGESVRRALGDSGSADSSGADERVAERVRSASIGPWPPDASRLTDVSSQLGTAVDDVLTKQGQARSDALEEALSRATSATFEGDFADHTASRFETNAYQAWRGGRDDEARDYLAVADRFRAGDLGEDRVARALTEVFVATILKRATESSSASEEDAAPGGGSAP
jgi:hypothetical protein